MTCIFYTGSALAADTAVVTDTKPSTLTDTARKVLLSANNQFAYAYCGRLPKITRENILKVEELLHRLLVGLAKVEDVTRLRIRQALPDWDAIDPDIAELAMGSQFYIITRSSAYDIGSPAPMAVYRNNAFDNDIEQPVPRDTATENVNRLNALESMANDLQSNLSDVVDQLHNVQDRSPSRSRAARGMIPHSIYGNKPNTFKAMLPVPHGEYIQGSPKGMGSGGNFALGAWYARPDLALHERIGHTFTTAAQLDPLMSASVDYVKQDQLSPLSVG